MITINDRSLGAVFADLARPFMPATLKKERDNPFMPAHFVMYGDLLFLLGSPKENVERKLANGDSVTMKVTNDAHYYSVTIDTIRQGYKFHSFAGGYKSVDGHTVSLHGVMIDNIWASFKSREETAHFLNYIGQQVRQVNACGMPHDYADEPYFKPLALFIERHNPWSHWRGMGVRTSTFQNRKPAL